MKNRIKKRVLNYLSFTRSERIGTIVLVVLLIMVIVVPILYREFIAPGELDKNISHAEVDDFFNNLSYKQKQQKPWTKKITIEEEEVVDDKNKGVLNFDFDPNTITTDSLMLLGLSAKQAAVVDNYRARGGKFRTPADFSKIYSIDSRTHSRLAPHVKIDTSIFIRNKEEGFGANYNGPVMVEINTADTVELCKIRGIGKSYAKRIIAYRTLLGGFHSRNQLLEIYGMTSDLYNKILPSVMVDSALTKKINLNTISFENLKAHPYISPYEAKSIIYYRSKVKTIRKTDEILQNKLLTSDRYKKVFPYLSIE